jgi:Tfp pilus assembly protein PilO
MKFDVSSLIEKFNGLSDQVRYGVLAGVAAFIVLVDVLLLMFPQIGAINDLHSQIDKLTSDTEQVTTDKQRIGLLRKNLEQEKIQLSGLSTKVQSIQDVPVILGNISSAANEYGIKIDELDPQKSLQESLMKTPDAQYYGLPIVFKAHGGYHAFGHFLNTLENNDMSFIMKEFSIQHDDTNPNTELFSLTIELVLMDKH